MQDAFYPVFLPLPAPSPFVGTYTCAVDETARVHWLCLPSVKKKSDWLTCTIGGRATGVAGSQEGSPYSRQGSWSQLSQEAEAQDLAAQGAEVKGSWIEGMELLRSGAEQQLLGQVSWS